MQPPGTGSNAPPGPTGIPAGTRTGTRVEYLPVLDGLRAIAVLLVLWSHLAAPPTGFPQWVEVARFFVGPGGLGVDVFFVLSGFLITRILLAERAAGVPVRWFLLRRCLRIVPIYYLLLLAVLLVWGWRRELPWCALYLVNFYGVFLPPGGPLAHTWSLCIEEHFYLLWPFAIAFASRARALRTIWFVVVPVAFLANVLGILWLPHEQAVEWMRHSSPTRFFTLACGCLLAFAEPWIRLAPRRAACLAAALIAVGYLLTDVVLVYVIPYHLNDGVQIIDVRWLPITTLCATTILPTGLLLLCIAAPHGDWRLRWLTAAPLRAIGRISYGVYLYHLPIYCLWLYPSPTWARAAAVVAATFAVATVSWFLVERPLLRFGSRFR